jgi:SAM-dependent methyltransferase
MSLPSVDAREATWHDVECGAYTADLAAWTELAREAAAPVLELGCGTGRVALTLAGAGFEVTAVDSSPSLVAALNARAGARELEVEGLVADARELSLERSFGLIAAPMQLAHLMGGAAGRERLLRRGFAHLAPGGAFALAVLAEDPGPMGAPSPPLPDVLERDGYVYSSLPVEVRAAGTAIEVRRLRQLVAPGGELSEEIDSVRLDRLPASRLEAEAEEVGLTPRERIEVPPTSDHVGSTIVVLEAAAR